MVTRSSPPFSPVTANTAGAPPCKRKPKPMLRNFYKRNSKSWDLLTYGGQESSRVEEEKAELLEGRLRRGLGVRGEESEGCWVVAVGFGLGIEIGNKELSSLLCFCFWWWWRDEVVDDEGTPWPAAAHGVFRLKLERTSFLWSGNQLILPLSSWVMALMGSPTNAGPKM